MLNIWIRIAQKLRRTILLHFGLVTSRIHFRNIWKVAFSWFVDLADVTMTPKNQSYLSLEAPGYLEWSRGIPESLLQEYYFRKSHKFGTRSCSNIENVGTEQSWRAVLIGYLMLDDSLPPHYRLFNVGWFPWIYLLSVN